MKNDNQNLLNRATNARFIVDLSKQFVQQASRLATPMGYILRRKNKMGVWGQTFLALLLTAAVAIGFRQVYGQSPTCNSNINGAYTVTLCFNAPANGATITGVVPVTPSITVSGTSPGISRLVYWLNGQYLLTSVATPFSFQLPSTYFVDGAYTLQVEAVMRDGYTTQRTTVTLTFNNGITTPPVNTNTFTPWTNSVPAGQSLIVAATGDGAGGRPEAAQVANDIVARQPHMFLYLGDVYEKGMPTEFYNWYGTQNYFFGQFKGKTNPAIGNHEYEFGVAPGYFDYWNNIPNYYSYNAAGWHFISINSTSNFGQTSPGSAQYQWLNQDLNQNNSNCTVAYWHEPLFNIGPQGPATRMSDIWSLLVQKGADLVLTGHDHNYQRWQPLDGNGNPSAQGIPQFIAGMGGHGIRPLSTTDSRVAVAFDNPTDSYGSLYLALNPDGAEYRYINVYNEVLDFGVIPCNGAPTDTTVPTTPSNLATVANSNQEVILSWNAAWDNTGVLTYTILRNGAVIGSVNGATLSYTDYGAALNSSYSYRVKANDLAGNQSAQSNAVNVTTPVSRTITLLPVADTYSNPDSPTTNYGTATTLRTDASPTVNSYLRFDVPPLVGIVLTATLRVYPNSGNNTGYSVRSMTDNSWGESTVTYNNAPTVGNVIGTSGAVASGNWSQVAVNTALQGGSLNSFAMSGNNGTATSYSSRQGANPPQLVIVIGADTTSTATPTPTDTETPIPTPTNTETSTSTPTATSTPVPIPTISIFTPEADSYTSSTAATTNFGSASVLWVDSAAPVQSSYLRFNIQGISGSIVSATVQMYAETTLSAGFRLYDLPNDTWVESTINYNNAPAMGVLVNSSGSVSANTWKSINVTSLVTQTGPASFGLTTNNKTGLRFTSRNTTGANAPRLIVQSVPVSAGRQASAVGSTIPVAEEQTFIPSVSLYLPLLLEANPIADIAAATEPQDSVLLDDSAEPEQEEDAVYFIYLPNTAR